MSYYTPARNGLRWEKSECLKAVEFFKNGWKLSDIAKKLERTQHALLCFYDRVGINANISFSLQERRINYLIHEYRHGLSPHLRTTSQRPPDDLLGDYCIRYPSQECERENPEPMWADSDELLLASLMEKKRLAAEAERARVEREKQADLEREARRNEAANRILSLMVMPLGSCNISKDQWESMIKELRKNADVVVELLGPEAAIVAARRSEENSTDNSQSQ